MSRETLGMRTLYQNRTTDMIQVRRTTGLYLTNCNSKDTEISTTWPENLNFLMAVTTGESALCLFLAWNIDVVSYPAPSWIQEGSADSAW